MDWESGERQGGLVERGEGSRETVTCDSNYKPPNCLVQFEMA